MNKTIINRGLLWPVLAGFFIMGFCDLVAPVTKLIGTEFRDAAGWVSLLPSMAFVWFLVLSIPIASLMNRAGRKSTALCGYALTFVGLMIPFCIPHPTLLHYFVGFGLLGIGNTIVQVAINPLLATLVPNEQMTSYLTIGQIFRNTSLLLVAPLVTLFVAQTESWRWLLLLYGGITLVGTFWLWRVPVAEPAARGSLAGLGDCFRLLGNRTVLLATLGVGCFISADVGISFVAVQLIDQPSAAMLTTTGFYACRIVGTLLGAWLLVRYSDVKYLRINMIVALVFVVLLTLCSRVEWIYCIMGVLGFTFACAFATFYAHATQAAGSRSNEVAGLMILVAAGMLPGPICGTLIAAGGQAQWGVLFPALCIAYMWWAARDISKQKKER